MRFLALTSPLLLFLLSISSLASASNLFRSVHRRAPAVAHISDGEMHPGTYPRATRLADNSLLGAVSFNDGVTTNLVTIRSDDDGQTWTPHGIIDTAPSDQRDLDNPFIIEIPEEGRLLVAFRNHDRVVGQPGKYSWYRITLCESLDGGAHWQFVTQVRENAAGADLDGTWEPFMRHAADGKTIQMYYSHENNAGDQDSILQKAINSDGKGWATWTEPKVVTGGGLTARDGMTGVAELNGRLYIVFESQPDGHFQIFMMESGDDGETWENRRVIFSPTCADVCNAGAPQIVTVGDKLVVSFMTDEDGPYNIWAGSGSAKLISSGDAGATWSGATLVSGAGSLWPGLLRLDDANFLIMYQAPTGTATAARFSVA